MPRLRVIDDEVIERPFDKRQFLRLLTFLKPYRKPIAFSLCLMVTNAVCSLALPMLMSRAIDEINVGNSSSFGIGFLYVSPACRAHKFVVLIPSPRPASCRKGSSAAGTGTGT